MFRALQEEFSRAKSISGRVTDPSPATRKKETAKPGDEDGHQGWQKFDLGIFSFYAPKELKGGSLRGVDSRIWSYEGGGMTLDIDAGLYGGRPTYVREFASYRDEFLTIDGASALLWFYQNEQGDRKYVGAVHYSFKGMNENTTMILDSEDENVQEIAEKIFMSVNFQFERKENRPR